MLWDSFDDGSRTTETVVHGMNVEMLKNVAGREPYGYTYQGRYYDMDGNYCHENVALYNHDSIEGLYVKKAQAICYGETEAHYISGTHSDQPLAYTPEDEVVFFIPVGEQEWEALMVGTYEDLEPIKNLPKAQQGEEVLEGLETEDGENQFILVKDQYTNRKWRRV